MKISRRAANGSLSSVHFIAWNFRRSVSVKLSSFLLRNDIWPSNALLLSTVSMWKTLSVFSTRSPWRLNECDKNDFGGSMYELESTIVLGLWCAFNDSYPHSPT